MFAQQTYKCALSLRCFFLFPIFFLPVSLLVFCRLWPASRSTSGVSLFGFFCLSGRLASLAVFSGFAPFGRPDPP
ncbi:MAG: hypothetical protein AAFS03_05890, partial [Pseudomonadota bacterium]